MLRPVEVRHVIVIGGGVSLTPRRPRGFLARPGFALRGCVLVRAGVRAAAAAAAGVAAPAAIAPLLVEARRRALERGAAPAEAAGGARAGVRGAVRAVGAGGRVVVMAVRGAG
jgi:hypothetical protein